jgi:hypothetical protein
MRYMKGKTEMTEIAETTETNNSKSGSNAMGIIKGVPGEEIHAVGVLDLRGVSPEELQKLKVVEATGAILIDENQKSALAHCKMEAVGAVIELAADEKVMLQPFMEITRATMEGMAAGQRFTLIGILSFTADVPPALVQEKIEALRLIGVMMATPGVQGALFGKLQHTGVTVTIGESDGPLVRNMGHTRLTAGYLSHLMPNSHYLNLGHTEVAPDVTVEQLSNVIAVYHNVGATSGPKPLIELLRARCQNNLGAFDEQDVAETAGESSS